MVGNTDVNEGYRLALCCNPAPEDKITGFLKPDDGMISVHKKGCHNLKSIQKERLLSLDWREVIKAELPDDSGKNTLLDELDDIDIRILRHHAGMGADYAAVVAKYVGIDRATVFEKHRKLRDLDLLRRVQPRMIQYRKNIVDHKWIKHRNHTYYEITGKGLKILRGAE